ncbi:Kinesin-like protein KIN-14I [Camellia lanceoleosa]|uniref:Kinesin-like protein KIN-14I n=1 Tax=Camellia lanceoleosa TaxID=1840588 RepID=A0ACC0FVS5_9ERIC|nr:Kinesin-like protein KIN-14I [Camellia lanceoleosa]
MCSIKFNLELCQMWWSPWDSALIPDGATLFAYQYFENVRIFLIAAQELGLSTFEASDLEQVVVICVLALKSYNDWKQTGANRVWKFGGNVKTVTSGKHFMQKNSEPFTSSLTRNLSMDEKSLNAIIADLNSNNKCSSSLSMLVRAILLDKKPEEVPTSMPSKVVEEFEHCIANQTKKKTSIDVIVSLGNKYLLKHGSGDFQELQQTLHTTKVGMQFMQMKFHEDIHNVFGFLQRSEDFFYLILISGLHRAAHSFTYLLLGYGYHKVLEENRKLYNQGRDLKGSIRAYCRVRPFLGGQSKYLSTLEHTEEGTITITTPSKYKKGHRSFNFNKVFRPSATQAEVFLDTQLLIRSVLDGYNLRIFAYGQIRSGKTYKMNTVSYDVFVQVIEIYNEQVRDLLITDGLNKRYPLMLVFSQTGLNVPDASLVRVTSTSDVIDLMNLGQKNCVVGATTLNDRSSCSHIWLTVHVQGRDLTSGTSLRSCMHLVDLAGSERVDKSEFIGDRLKEAQHINKSLSTLCDVISSLAQKNSHVPYRNSKLTQLLQDSLGGQAKTLMFVHISPELDADGETISTLKFAQCVATVELGTTCVNKNNADVM